VASAKVTSKGQITIPKEVRKALDLDTGDRIAFLIRPGGIVEMRAENTDVTALFGILEPKKRGVTVARMKRDIAEAARRDRS
jgi:antitoxin PrlF